MIELFRKKIYNIYGSQTKKSYHIILMFDFIATILSLAIFGYIFDCIPFVIISSLVMFRLSDYSYHLHFHNLDNCLIATITLTIIYGIISKSTLDYIWLTYFIVIWCIRDMMIKAPLRKIKQDKSEDWHKEKFIKWIIIFLLLSLILYYFNIRLVCSCIIWSLVLYDTTFYINPTKL